MECILEQHSVHIIMYHFKRSYHKRRTCVSGVSYHRSIIKRGGSQMVNRVGQQLGNYRLISLLGTGGFADVYLGEHVYLDTPAAIKVMNAQLATQDIESF